MGALDLVDSWDAPGAAAGVVGDGGVATRGDTSLVSGWASVTKLVTTLATLVAVEEGTVALDDAAGPPGSTIRHLLAHASGLAPDEEEAVSAPGHGRVYSNAGFEVLAGAVAERAGMAFDQYLTEAVLDPLGMRTSRLEGSPAHALAGSLDDLIILASELRVPTLVSGDTMRAATSVAFPGLAGVLPGFGRHDPLDWGLGFEVRDAKSPHWTGRSNSPSTFGHYGRSGSFLWVDPDARLASAALSRREFGPWVARAWPAFSDAVLEEFPRLTLAAHSSVFRGMIGRVDTTVGAALEATEGTQVRRIEHHSGDSVRVVLGLIVLAITSVLARTEDLSAFERNSFHLLNQLPNAFHSFFATVQQAGAFPAVIVVAVAALVMRRPRLAATFVLVGASAWFLAKLLKDLTGRPRPFLIFSDTIVRGTAAEGLGFPSGHSAVSAALATVLSPYLPRWGRRAVWAVVVLVGVARIYVGAHLPLDVLGGFALGWAVGAGANLVVGTPPRRPDLGALRRLFSSHGLVVVSLDPLPAYGRGPQPYVVRTADGAGVFTKIVSNEERDADALFKVWRHLSYRGIEDEMPFLSPRRIVEHEAFMSLLAERGRVSTPRVVLAGPVSDGIAALAEDLIEGRTLDRMAPAEISDETLTAFWQEVAKLRVARIAHRDLRLGNLMVGVDGRAWILDFGFAESEASERALARDLAELLTALATAAGVARSVRTAVDVLGPAALKSALPLLQPLALSRGTRRDCRHHNHLLAELRQQTAAATLDLETLPRVRARTLVVLGLAAIAIYAVVPQLGQFDQAWDAIAHADPAWIAAAIAASAATYLAAAVQLQGAVPDRLNLIHTVQCALSSSFANRITPAGVGGVATNVRYLQRCGFGLPEAGSYVALNSAVGFVVHMSGLLVTGLLVGSRADSVKLPPLWVMLGGLGAFLAVAALVAWLPPVRRAVVPQVHKVLAGLKRMATQPTHLAGLVFGAASVTGLYVTALDVSLRAVGVQLGFSEVAVVYLGGAVVANVVPVPGGIGVMELALTAGLTGFGVPAATALAGALCFRLVTFWLPIVPGALAMRHMRRLSLL